MSSLLPCLLTEAPVGGSIVLPVGRPRALFGSAAAQPFLLDLMRGDLHRSQRFRCESRRRRAVPFPRYFLIDPSHG